MVVIMNTKKFKLGNKTFSLLFLTTVGSQLHKLNLKNSDVDLKGVFVWDTDTLFSLVTPQDTMDYKNTDPDEWADLMQQFNTEFNLNLDPDDDVSLFDLRKFFVTSMKNDFNMFDMLFSAEKPVFNTEPFQKVLDNKEQFLDMKNAVNRFGGMARGALHESKKLFRKTNRTDKENNDLKKNKAKSLQFLFSLDNLLKTGSHNPVLNEEQRFEVLQVKSGLVPMEVVEERHTVLTAVLEKTLNLPNVLDKTLNRKLLNDLLVSTFKSSLL